MFHSVTCRLKETVDSPRPSVDKVKERSGDSREP